MSKRGTSYKPRRRSARLQHREDSPHDRHDCICNCKVELTKTSDNAEKLEDIQVDLCSHLQLSHGTNPNAELNVQNARTSIFIDSLVCTKDGIKQEAVEAEALQVSEQSNGRQPHQPLKHRKQTTTKYRGHLLNAAYDQNDKSNYGELTECLQIRKRVKSRAKNLQSRRSKPSTYIKNDTTLRQHTQIACSKTARRKKAKCDNYTSKISEHNNNGSGLLVSADIPDNAFSVQDADTKSEAVDGMSHNILNTQSALNSHDKWVDKDNLRSTEVRPITEDLQADLFNSDPQTSSNFTPHNFGYGEKTLAMTTSLDRNINAFNDDHSSCVRKLPDSWLTKPSADEPNPAAEDNSLSETIYNGLSLLNSSPSDTNEVKNEMPSTSSNVMSVMIPNPFTIQHGLQQTFDFAAFRPVSPLSRRESLEKTHETPLTQMSHQNMNVRAHTDTQTKNTTRVDQMANRSFASVDSRLKVELTSTTSELTAARRDKIAVSDTKLTLCGRESKQSPRPLRRVSRSKSGKQRQTSIVHMQNSRAKTSVEKSPRTASGNKMKYQTRTDVPAAGGEAPRSVSTTSSQPANSLLNGQGSQLYRNRRCSKQMSPWLQQALKGTLTHWENYLKTTPEKMHSFEVENAKHFNYNKIAKAVIEDRNLHVWQLIDEMTASFDS